MSCKDYQDALTDAAANGAEPRVELRVHLLGCTDCRAAFEQEQSLFASIDAGLHITANAEVPASLLPRVRAKLDEAAGPQRRWFESWVLAAASFALAFAVFLVARPHRSGPNSQAKHTPQIEAPATNASPENYGRGRQIVSSLANNSQTRGHSTSWHAVASSQPEVLVPPDEREAFARFVAALQERGDVAVALVTPAPLARDRPADLEVLQINELEIKPLAGTESGQLGGAQQKQ